MSTGPRVDFMIAEEKPSRSKPRRLCAGGCGARVSARENRCGPCRADRIDETKRNYATRRIIRGSASSAFAEASADKPREVLS